MPDQTKWRGYHTLALLAIIVAIFLLGLFIPDKARAGSWIATLILLLLFLVITGEGITGFWRGALIDERNKMSLSRFQLVLWTCIVLSAYLAAVLANLAKASSDPLAVGIPSELWILMGISATSLVASPLVSSNKKKPTPDPVEEAYTINQLSNQGTDPKDIGSQGLIVVNSNPEMARWSDMFKGEETGNAALLDIGKIQMFYFTLIAALAYAFALGTQFRAQGSLIDHLPALPNSFLALLGISHAAYLANKSVPHSDTQ
jgi:hypothetical protein